MFVNQLHIKGDDENDTQTVIASLQRTVVSLSSQGKDNNYKTENGCRFV